MIKQRTNLASGFIGQGFGVGEENSGGAALPVAVLLVFAVSAGKMLAVEARETRAGGWLRFAWRLLLSGTREWDPVKSAN